MFFCSNIITPWSTGCPERPLSASIFLYHASTPKMVGWRLLGVGFGMIFKTSGFLLRCHPLNLRLAVTMAMVMIHTCFDLHLVTFRNCFPEHNSTQSLYHVKMTICDIRTLANVHVMDGFFSGWTWWVIEGRMSFFVPRLRTFAFALQPLSKVFVWRRNGAI